MDNEFSRLQMLVGEEALNKLKAAHVAVFGIGGVGGYVAEALARSGISNLDLIINALHHSRRTAYRYHIFRNILSHNRAGADDRIITDRHT